jgi:hypothetical protein
VLSGAGAGMRFFEYWSPSGRFTRAQWWRFQIYAMFGVVIVVFISINISYDYLRVGFVALAIVFADLDRGRGETAA